MNKRHTVSASIVSYDSRDKLVSCINTMMRFTTGCELTAYVIDNNCELPDFEALSKYPVSVIKNNRNEGFGAAHNRVLPLLNSEYHAVINPDIVFCEDTLTKLCDYLDEHPDVIMAMPTVLNPDGSLQGLPRRDPTLRYLLSGRLPGMKNVRNEYTMAADDLSKPTEIEFCSGCFFVIRTDALKKLGGFDERFFLYFEDADFSRRARKMGKIQIAPVSKVTHMWERSSAKSLKYFLIHIDSCIKYFIKWRKSR